MKGRVHSFMKNSWNIFSFDQETQHLAFYLKCKEEGIDKCEQNLEVEVLELDGRDW